MFYRRSSAPVKTAVFVAAVGILVGVLTLSVMAVPAAAQYQDRDRDRDRDYDRVTRIEPGTLLAVRTNETIDVERRDNRVYYGIVDQDVRGENGRLAIPRGSNVEMIVRTAPDNDLVIDVESVTVNGQRFAIRTDTNRQESMRDNSVVGAIVGAIQGGEARGRAVRIPRDSTLTFRIARPLELGVADRGIMRDGRHYHDYYRN